MNNNDLYSVDFTHSLPPVLKNDPDMLALAQTVAEQLRLTAGEIRKNIIYARIDELDEQTLDILAYDLHVDWYDYSYPIEVKRKTIKDSVKVHRKLGTKYAVETALRAIFPIANVEEWFEYDGKPYHFRLIIDVSNHSVDPQKHRRVIERVAYYKNLRSVLDSIYLISNHAHTVYCACWMQAMDDLTLEQERPDGDYELQAFGGSWMTQYDNVLM